MTIVTSKVSILGPLAQSGGGVSPGIARLAIVVSVAACAMIGVLITGAADGSAAVAQAGEDLTRLLRLMALLKVAMALAAAALVVWRLGSPVSPGWLVAYGAACGGMSVGPGLIWSMAHVGIGALALHGGLLAAGLLLWRDPVVATRLADLLAHRRSTHREARSREGTIVEMLAPRALAMPMALRARDDARPIGVRRYPHDRSAASVRPRPGDARR